MFGAAAGDRSGFAVAAPGDADGDGFGDLLIGAPDAGSAGAAYLVFGRPGEVAPVLDLAASGAALRIDGVAAGDLAGAAVSGGDVNGDGLGDLVIAAPEADPSGRTAAGAVYVVFGRSPGFGAGVDLAALDGTDGLRIDGPAGAGLGAAVAVVGDVNGDGIADMALAASGAVGPGGGPLTYVVFGRASGFDATLDLAAPGAAGATIEAPPSAFAVSALSDAGDVNGDGIADMILGAAAASPGGRAGAGAAYVVFGRSGGFAGPVALGSLGGADGFVVPGLAAGDGTGGSVSGAGDLNGDGIDDLVIGADGADPAGRAEAGRAYVVFGRPDGFGASLDLAALDGTDGFRIDGLAAGDLTGVSVGAAGDVNGDGTDDLVLGASGVDVDGRDNAGAAYVVFGRADPAAVLDLAALDGTDGYRLEGVAAGDLTGLAASGAGDLDGDGIDDLAVAAWRADPAGRSNAGRTAVVFGARSPIVGGGGSEVLTGTDFDDLIEGGAGDDTLEGRGGDDTLIGGDGADTAVYGADAGARIALFVASRIAPASTAAAARVDLSLTGAQDTGGYGADSLSEIENLRSGAGDDALGGAEGANRLEAGGGDDTLEGRGGDDTLVGGAGRDLAVYGGTAGARVDLSLTGAQDTGGYGADSLSEIENLRSGGGDDALGGAEGANRLEAGGGDDTLEGRGGDDTLVGGAGRDLVVYGGTAAARVDLSLTGAQDTGGYGADSLSEIENLRSGGGDDALGGAEGANRLEAGGGDDTLEGRGGDDTLVGGAGRDRLSGDLGDDRLVGGAETDVAVYGGTAGARVDLSLTGAQDTGGYGADSLSEIENLRSGGGDDALGGAEGANRVEAGGGDDTLEGRGGDDTLVGGAGRDRLSGGLGDDALSGGAGIDVAIYAGAGAVRLDLARTGGQNTGRHGRDRLSEIEDLRTGSGADALAGSGGANRLDSAAGDDTLEGRGGGDRLFAGAGRDRLSGGGGADSLVGGAGDDALEGGAGADTLEGGSGRDRLVGGAGADLFRFRAASESRPGAADMIEGAGGAPAFSRSEGDRIDLSAIDADALLPRAQAFLFGAGRGVGRLWAEDDAASTDTLIFGNADLDAAPEFMLVIRDGVRSAAAYGEADFLL